MQSTRCLGLTLTVLIFVGGNRESTGAPILTSHGFAAIRVQNPPTTGESVAIYTTRNGTLSGVDTGIRSGVWNNRVHNYGASGRAFVNPRYDQLLGAQSSAFGEGTGLFAPAGFAHAYTAWRDVILVEGPHPELLRLTFHVHAELSATASTLPGGNSRAKSELGLSYVTRQVDQWFEGIGTEFGGDFRDMYEPTVTYGNVGGVDISPSQQGFIMNGWLADDESWPGELLFKDGVLTGSFVIDVPYDASLGGYGFGISMGALSSAKGGSSSVLATNTLGLTTVTEVDGTPIDVYFDSGLSLNSPAEVPEPSTIALFGLSGLVLFVRRNLASVQR